MSKDADRGPAIIEAHQEMVEHVEQSAGRIRILSIVTVVVSVVLALSYVSQLALPFAGTSKVIVNLSDPVNVATELVVLALALIWLYVGMQNLRFSTRLRSEIETARLKEKDILDKIS